MTLTLDNKRTLYEGETGLGVDHTPLSGGGGVVVGHGEHVLLTAEPDCTN